MSKQFQITGNAHLVNSLDYTSSISLDREAATVSFGNLALHLTSHTREPLLTQTASFLFPIQSEVDLTVKLAIAGVVSVSDGVCVTLIVHRAGQTSLVELPGTPSYAQESNSISNIDQSFTDILPAGQRYHVALFLLLERLVDDATGFVQIDLLEIELKQIDR